MPKHGTVEPCAAEAVRSAFAHRFVEAQYAWTTMLLDHLILCRRRIGDLDAVLVLGVLGLSALATARHQFGQPAAGTPPDHRPDTLPPGGGINIQSLADITCIPRETVRRKLDMLARAGFVERQPEGDWRLRPGASGDAAARHELQDVSDDAVDGLARLCSRLLVLAGSAPPPAAADPAAARR